jgi:hypothetical protein
MILSHSGSGLLPPARSPRAQAQSSRTFTHRTPDLPILCVRAPSWWPSCSHLFVVRSTRRFRFPAAGGVKTLFHRSTSTPKWCASPQSRARDARSEGAEVKANAVSLGAYRTMHAESSPIPGPIRDEKLPVAPGVRISLAPPLSPPISRYFRELREIRVCACDLRDRPDPENASSGGNGRNPANPIPMRFFQVHP